jgi:hypothetical protein
MSEWLAAVPTEPVALVGAALVAWAVVAVVVGWARGSWWAVPATTALAFGAALALLARERRDAGFDGDQSWTGLALVLQL